MKCDQSRSFVELPHETDTSFTLKLNGSFMTFLSEDESPDKRGHFGRAKPGQNSIINSMTNTVNSPNN